MLLTPYGHRNKYICTETMELKRSRRQDHEGPRESMFLIAKIVWWLK